VRRRTAAAVLAVFAAACRRAPEAARLPPTVPLPERSAPDALCATSDGALWVTLTGLDVVRRVESTPPYRAVDVPVRAGSRPRGIAVGSDGAPWFVEEVGNRVGRIQPEWPYTLVEYEIPTRLAPVRIAAGPDRAMWFTSGFTPVIGRVAVDSPHAITEIATPGPPQYRPSGIPVTAGPGDTIWFSRYNEICWLHTARLTSPIQCRAASTSPFPGPVDLVRASDGAVWLTVAMEGIQRQDPETGRETYLLALGRDHRARLAADAKGRIWATSAGGLWEIPLSEPSRAIVHPLRTDYGPGAIAVAPDGRVWFVDTATRTLNVFAP
jgi:virginiamycin B lyase